MELTDAIVAASDAVSATLELFTAKQVRWRHLELHESHSTIEDQFLCHDDVTPALVLIKAWEGSGLNLVTTFGILRYLLRWPTIANLRHSLSRRGEIVCDNST